MPSIPEMIDAVLEPSSLQLRTDQNREFAARFAADMRAVFARWGDLTQRQYAVLERLHADLSRPPPAAADLAGITSIRELFDRAASRGLKRPSITVHVDDCELELSRAPDTGRNPGAIYVKSNEEYLGKILGTEFTSRSITPEAMAALTKFGNDPAGIAAASGHLTGRCSFCNRKLTDERSTAVGYGATCADNYGLPWGE